MPGIVGIIIGSAALLIVGAVLWWQVPKWQMRSITASHPKDRADIEDNFRKTIGQALGGVFILLAAGMAYFGTLQTIRVNEDQARRTQQSALDLLISNQVSKGFEQLASKDTVMQLGGIYALEGVMKASEQYHQPVLEALCAFVRDRTKAETDDGPPATEIQAALTVIGRRLAIEEGRELSPDLSNAHIPKVDLHNANLTDADLGAVDLSKANLSGANLSGAKLTGANLTSAYLPNANLNRSYPQSANLTTAYLNSVNLSGADLTEANLSGATLYSANLSSASLILANLKSAHLIRADLSGAYLSGANLTAADLGTANLSGANLNGADLTKATVSQTQLDQACGTKVTLDPGLTIKPCP
jgi:uncharacterized protein YjbI with pentapeptide repeats